MVWCTARVSVYIGNHVQEVRILTGSKAYYVSPVRDDTDRFLRSEGY